MISREAKEFFYNLHDIDCNQKYGDNLPYSFHLKATVNTAEYFKECIPLPEIVDNLAKATLYIEHMVIAAGHDSIEDARITFNQIRDKFGIFVAEGIFGCTESTGRTRKERKDEAYYKRLLANKASVYVKLCDIIANTNYSILTFNEERLQEKREDFDLLLTKLDDYYMTQYKPMIDYLKYLYGIKI